MPVPLVPPSLEKRETSGKRKAYQGDLHSEQAREQLRSSLPLMRSLAEACGLDQMELHAIDSHRQRLNVREDAAFVASIVEELQQVATLNRRLGVMIARREHALCSIEEESRKEDEATDSFSPTARQMRKLRLQQHIGLFLDLTTGICEQVSDWRQHFTLPLPFMVEDSNYVMKLLFDSQRVGAIVAKSGLAGVLHPSGRHPLAVPAMSVVGPVQTPTRSQRRGKGARGVVAVADTRSASHAAERPRKVEVQYCAALHPPQAQPDVQRLLAEAAMFPYTTPNDAGPPNHTDDDRHGALSLERCRAAELLIVGEFSAQLALWRNRLLCCERAIYVPILKVVLHAAGPVAMPPHTVARERQVAEACFRSFAHTLSISQKAEMGLLPTLLQKAIDPAHFDVSPMISHLKCTASRSATAQGQADDFVEVLPRLVCACVTAALLQRHWRKLQGYAHRRRRGRTLADSAAHMTCLTHLKRRLTDWSTFVLRRRRERHHEQRQLVALTADTDVRPPSLSAAGAVTSATQTEPAQSPGRFRPRVMYALRDALPHVAEYDTNGRRVGTIRSHRMK